jgi:hypothetical protein
MIEKGSGLTTKFAKSFKTKKLSFLKNIRTNDSKNSQFQKYIKNIILSFRNIGRNIV